MIIFWATLYGLAYLLDTFSKPLYPIGQALPLATVLYTGILIFWLIRTKRACLLGLVLPSNLQGKALLSILPLCLLPLCNLLAVEALQISLSFVLLMLCVSIVEELFFRGTLLRFFSKQGPLVGIILSSIFFALFHGVNLLHGANPVYTVLQIACAFAVGTCYGAVMTKYHSILPCIAAHFLTNLTGATNGGQAQPLFWLCTAVYMGYGIWLCRDLSRKSFVIGDPI